MKRVNLKDKNFSHQECTSRYGRPELVEWDRTCSQPGPVVYTDLFLNDQLRMNSGKKIAWLLEPIVIYPHAYIWTRRNWQMFEEVWTHDEEILNAIPNARWIPMGGTWVSEENWKIHDKTKLCSFIASSKNAAPGHKLRQQVRSMLPAFIDQYGAGYRHIENKSEGLNDYRFSIVIENCMRNTYFTEKIIDCFLTGTVPVYWGTYNIGHHFDMNGIIRFEKVEELQVIIHTLNNGKYEQMKESILLNYKLGHEYLTAEDFIIKTGAIK